MSDSVSVDGVAVGADTDWRTRIAAHLAGPPVWSQREDRSPLDGLTRLWRTLSDASALDRLVAEILDICSRTPPRGTPRTSDKHKATLALVMRLNLEAQYGANDLYSGMGATIQDNTGGLGAREVMLSQNDTKFALTDDNHKLVDLGQYTAADVEHSYSRPPSAPSSGGSK